MFKKKEQHLVARFTPLYLSNEIREIIIGILDHFMFEKTDDTDVQSVRILIDNITVRFPLDFGQIGSDAPGIVWIIELLISRNLVSSIEIFPEQVIDYVQTHGVENVPEFIQFVLFFNEPPIWFSDVPLIYIGKIMSMGPKSKTLMYGVLRRMSTKVLESMPSEFKKRIRKTYNYDQSIEKMLFKTDDDDDDVITEEEEEDEEAMEAEYKKIKK